MFIDIKHLQALQSIDKHRSFVGASYELCITQSALSHQVKKLESYYQIKILNRQNRPLTWTYAGKKLLKLANNIVPKIKRVNNQLQQIKKGNTGRLHIAVECHSCFDWLMPSMNEYRKIQPTVDMDISQVLQFEPINSLLNGIVDVAITSAKIDHKNLNFTPIFNYNLMLAVSTRNHLSDKKYITEQDLSRQTLISYPVPEHRLDVYKKFLHPAGLAPRYRQNTELTQMMIQKVASNIGVCALPQWVSFSMIDERQIKFIPIGKQGLQCTLYVCTLNNTKNLQYIKDFVKISSFISKTIFNYRR
ncbi:MAG: LysR family transcriptional regulator [Gammaproteobacteria bacterium]|nr:MAG: LysR family transcriptional regulator [Gammaproteobacteria bacterium]